MFNRAQYIAKEVAKNGQDKGWWRNRFSSRFAGPVLGRIYRNDGIDFMTQDWDNLLLLDACRADMFRSVIDTLQFDTYRPVHSIGCSSPEWMRETFSEREFPDTVYVSANPWISKIAPDSFHDVINLWDTLHDIDNSKLYKQNILEDTVQEGPPTIHADTVTEEAQQIHEEYPDKRLIVHYFQPHAPCVGNSDGTRKESVDTDMHPGDDLREGNVTRSEVWRAYQENLAFAFEHVQDLMESVGGKSVVTADHGELFGEWLWPFPMRGYAHPSGVRHPKLTEVPWAEKTIGSRREITRGEISTHETNEAVVNERLRNLGYKV